MTTINWDVTRQAFALLGYEFTPPEDFLDKPAEIQLAMWDMFLQMYIDCELQCAWKGGGPCLRDNCPRVVLRRVSMSALPLVRK